MYYLSDSKNPVQKIQKKSQAENKTTENENFEDSPKHFGNGVKLLTAQPD